MHTTSLNRNLTHHRECDTIILLAKICNFFITTGWVYNWNKKGAYTQKYRVRATIKLSPSGENLDIKSEAQYGGQSGWKSGFDDRLLQTLKSDISGVIGRVAR